MPSEAGWLDDLDNDDLGIDDLIEQITVGGDGRSWSVSLLDVEVPEDEVRFLRLTRAYRRWLGEDQ